MKLNTFDKELQDLLLLRAPKPIAKCGEIVMTQWGDWKHPHKVRITEIGAELANLNIAIGKRNEWFIEGWLGVQLYYYANRVNGKGELVGAQGCALTNVTTFEGLHWERRFPIFNHVGLSVTIERITESEILTGLN